METTTNEEYTTQNRVTLRAGTGMSLSEYPGPTETPTRGIPRVQSWVDVNAQR